MITSPCWPHVRELKIERGVSEDDVSEFRSMLVLSNMCSRIRSMVHKCRLIKVTWILLASEANSLKILGSFLTVTNELKGQISSIFSKSLPFLPECL